MNLTTRHSISKAQIAVVITLVAALGGLILPLGLIEGYIAFFGVLLILAGVPHGATDFLIIQRMSDSMGLKNSAIRFLAYYLLIIAAYVAIWLTSPLIAFALFLLISAYHFGQSNWARTSFRASISAIFSNIAWGLAIIGVPILLHNEQAFTVIQEMTGSKFQLGTSTRGALIFLLMFCNVANFLHLQQQGVISWDDFKKETGNFFCLMLLFFTTPLLVGFGVYFVFWHSLSSTFDQIEVVSSIDKKFGFLKYLKATVPLSLVALVGLAFLYYFFGHNFNLGQNLGTLFLFVSVITVPHSVLMEWLYRVGGPFLKERC